MTGIRSDLLYSYTTSKTACVPRTAKQVIAGCFSQDEDQKPKTDVSKMRRALKSGAENLANETHVSVIDNMHLYSKALEKQRKNTQDASLAKKKIKYSFKKISSKIITSKTSMAAREVVSQAKREIQKLKAARRTGKYDEEELEAALDHAKAMERIARKKVRHLEEEEMARRCSSSEEGTGAPDIDAEEPRDDKDPVQKEIDEIREELSDIEDRADNEGYIESEEITNEMISEMTRGMEEMLDAIEELADIMDELISNPADLDPEDIDAIKTRHRNKEMKEITKADSEYLKALFDHYEKVRSDSMTTIGGYEGTSTETAPEIDVAL